MKAFKIFSPQRDGAVQMDYQGNVTLGLKADTSWSPNSDIQHDSQISLNLGEIKPTGELYQKSYLVTVEEVKLNEGEHQREGYQRIIDERVEKEMRECGMSNEMIRRLKNVS